MFRQSNAQGRFHPYTRGGRNHVVWHQIYQHQSDNNRKLYIDEIEESISVNKADKISARELVDGMLGRLLADVRRQPGGEIYGVTVTKAGSYPVNTKIGKADEFDTNIPVNLQLERGHRESLTYKFVLSRHYMLNNATSTKMVLRQSIQPVYVPPGHRVIEVDTASVPQDFQHVTTSTHPQTTSTYYATSAYFSQSPWRPVARQQETLLNSGTVEGCIQVVPKDIKDDLMSKLRVAMKALDLHGKVSLQRKSHGPALTMIYKSGADQSVKHNIDIDIVPCLAYSINMSVFKWPRNETRRAFSADIIEQVLQAGTQLVPKHDLYWSVSFSRMERALQSGIDAGFGCRKYVLRILKRLLQKWKQQNSYFPSADDISSHILKTQLFWSCEVHCDDPGYWHRNNRDICLINTMEELKQSLNSRILPDYFFQYKNILDGKPNMTLRSLGSFISQKRGYVVELGHRYRTSPIQAQIYMRWLS